jgi:biopolymer transport protein ExbD
LEDAAMHIPTEQRVKTTRLQMTPLIDVVFLLITFFMVVTEIARQDQIEGLELPDAESAVRDEKIKRLTICVLRDGAYLVGGQRRSLEEVRDILIIHARLSRDVPVLIKADRRARYKYVRDLMKICVDRNIRIWRIAFAILPEET